MIMAAWPLGVVVVDEATGEIVDASGPKARAELERLLQQPAMRQYAPGQSGEEGAEELLNPGDPGHVEAVVRSLPGVVLV